MVLRRGAGSSYDPVIDATEFRDVIGRFATGVAIVTARAPTARRA